jgi:hypothetical protein
MRIFGTPRIINLASALNYGLPVGAFKNLRMSTVAIIRNKTAAAIITIVALEIGFRTGSSPRPVVLSAMIFLLLRFRWQETCRASILIKNLWTTALKNCDRFCRIRTKRARV